LSVLLVAVARLILFALTALASVGSGFILARKLAAVDYAVYQVSLRRGGLAVAALASAAGLWMYRSLSRGGGSGERAAALLLAGGAALLGAAWGAAAAPLLGLDAGSSLLLAAALAGMGAWTVARLAVEALRPLRAGAAALLQRLLNATLVVALVYLLRLGLHGALAAAAVAWWLAAAVALRWTGAGLGLLRSQALAALEVLRGWLRRAPAALPNTASTIVAVLDAVAVYALAGPLAVAGYTALTNILRLMVEAANSAMFYLHGLLLRGAGLEAAASAARLALLVSAPLLGYAAAHPEHLAALVNASYLWAAPLVPLAAAAVAVNVAGVAVQQMHRGLVEPGEGEAVRLARVFSLKLLAEIAYIAIVIAAVAAAGSPLEAGLGWAAAYLARGLLYALLPTAVEPRLRETALRLLASAAFYMVLGYAAAAVSPPPGPPAARFFREALLVARGLALALVLYAALVAVLDPYARGVAAAAVRRLPILTRRLGWAG